MTASRTPPEISAGAKNDGSLTGMFVAVMLVQALTLFLLWGLERYFSR